MAFTFKQLRYFIAVVDTGKVTNAALSVNISASSITEAIKSLEDFIGVELFKRTRTGLELTQAGYRFLVYANRILSDVESARYSILNDQNAINGVIRIGVTETVSGYFLAQLQQNFKRAFPLVDLLFEENCREKIEELVENQVVDLAIVLVSNVSPKKNFKILSLIRSQRRLWLPNDHHLLKKDVVTLEDVSREPYIQLTIDEATDSTASFWNNYQLKPSIIFSTSSVESVRSLVAKGMGVTILSDMVHRPWSLDGERVNTVELKEPIPTMNTGLIYLSKKSKNYLVAHFIDFCGLQYN